MELIFRLTSPLFPFCPGNQIFSLVSTEVRKRGKKKLVMKEEKLAIRTPLVHLRSAIIV